MWFRKSSSPHKEVSSAGGSRALDGHSAAYAVERMSADAVAVQSVPELAEITGPLQNLAPDGGAPSPGRFVFRQLSDLQGVLATVSGFAVEGMRASAFVDGLAGIHEALRAAAGRGLSFVIHLTSRAAGRHAGSLRGGHDDYFAAADSGSVQLFAKNVQEVCDFTLIAHRIAELSLTPVMCAQDLYDTSHSVQNLVLPEPGIIARFLGRAGDSIVSPTAAQRILFGGHRRRIPVLLDTDRPVGIGGVQDQESYYRAIAARRLFVAGHHDEIIEKAMHEFGELTGRKYEPLSQYRVDDADVVVVAQGSVVEPLKEVVDHLRSKEKIRGGVVGLNVLRPFPGAALTRALEGKKVVTVLERTDQPLAEDLPLTREIRAAIAKAAENAVADGDTPLYPGYAKYERPADRPRILSGVYGVGSGLPDFAALLAVFRNMVSTGKATRFFFVGLDSHRNTRRFPHLQTLQQRLQREYPELDELTIAVDTPEALPAERGRAFELLSLSVQGGLFAGNVFAQTLGEALGWHVATYPDGGLERSLQPARLTVWHDEKQTPSSTRPEAVASVLTAAEHLIEQLPPEGALKDGGVLVTGSARDPDALRYGLSSRAVRWIREHDIRFYAVDTRKIATETASAPSFVDQLAIWALLGAWLRVQAGLSEPDTTRFLEHLQMKIERLFGTGHHAIEEIKKAMTRGGEECRQLDWATWDDERVTAEEDTPWTVRELTGSEGDVFDGTRFWRSVGYLYDTAQSHETLTDPYIATGLVPARSSAFRDMTPYMLRLPRWRPQDCTGCGWCWAQCPESALPATIQGLASILETAVLECEKKGAAFIQMKRVGDHLAKQAHRMLVKGSPTPYVELGALFDDAFSQLVDKMNLEGDKLGELKKEYEVLRGVIATLPIAKTETFFDEADKKEKGAGQLLSIALNPLSCTACGVCVEVCPEEALEWAEQTPEHLERCRDDWRLQLKLPRVPAGTVDELVSESDPHTGVNRLLDIDAYHSLVGGDGSFPGNGSKTAVHLLTAAVESVMRPRFDAHIERLTGLIDRLEKKIQGDVEAAVKINDFEQFGQRLTRFKNGKLTAEGLAELFGDEEGHAIDRDRLDRLSGLLRELREQRACYVKGADGTGRSRMIMTIDPGNTGSWNGTYPYNPHSHPWVSQTSGDGPALAEAVFEGMTRRLVDELKTCRLAELELEDRYVAQQDDAILAALDWHELTDEERGVAPPVIVVTQTRSMNWQAVARVLSAGYPITVAVIDTEGPVTIEESSGEFAARLPDNPAIRALATRDAFVMQASIGHPGDLIRGVVESVTHRHPALLYVYAPDPQLSGIAPEKIAQQARLAYESRAVPLFRRDPGGGDVALDANPDPNQVWTTYDARVREHSGAETSLRAPLTFADWAVREARFQRYFTFVSTGHLHDHMRLLSEYLELDPDERGGIEPYVNVLDGENRRTLAIVSPEMVELTETASRFWNDLRSFGDSGVQSLIAKPVVEKEGEAQPASAQPALEPDVYQRLTERLLWLSGYSQDPAFFRQSLREFTTREGKAGLEE